MIEHASQLSSAILLSFAFTASVFVFWYHTNLLPCHRQVILWLRHVGNNTIHPELLSKSFSLDQLAWCLKMWWTNARDVRHQLRIVRRAATSAWENLPCNLWWIWSFVICKNRNSNVTYGVEDLGQECSQNFSDSLIFWMEEVMGLRWKREIFVHTPHKKFRKLKIKHHEVHHHPLPPRCCRRLLSSTSWTPIHWG